jgi:rfaE bifunctional protein nucleotidyltransferase chain/domain
MQEKILALHDLSRIVADCRRQSQRIVQCHGVFDLLHIGHIRYLQSAKQLGDILLVTVTPDRFVNKGPHRPAFEERLRVQALAALDCVDYVCLSPSPTACESLQALKPDIYVKGAEYRNQKTAELLAEEAVAASLGVQVQFIEDYTSSSTHLINHYLSPFPEEADRYLAKMRKQYSAPELLKRFGRARELRVLVVGEAILDEYVRCATLGQAAKSANVVGRYLSHERYLGGALAVANHLAAFCREVRLLSMLGTVDPNEDWIRQRLRAPVRAEFVYKPESPTILRRQFREDYFNTVLFEIDSLNETPLGAKGSHELLELFHELVANVDLVVAADYGHGMLGAAALEQLCARSPYLAVSAPANAANLGYHTISKYRRADYVSLAEQELRLDRRDRTGELPDLLGELADDLNTQVATVTEGSRGCMCHGGSADLIRAPALATRIVDRHGAGEAFLAVTSLCAALQLSLEELAFLGNVAGAEAVAVVGNSVFLEDVPFQRHVASLLK